MVDQSKRAVVLLSGGLDSATCLAIASSRGFECYCMSFDYGQRSSTELAAAGRVAEAVGAVDHKIVKLHIGEFGGSSLTDHELAIPEQETEGIPSTYVPARNTVFIAHALAWAEVLAADAIFIGVNALDYSGYPDCRPEYIDAFRALIRLATRAGVEGKPIALETPLIDLSKSEIIKTGTRLDIDYAHTVSCYQADEQGRACGRCDSCRLRSKGFEQAGISDPTRYQR